MKMIKLEDAFERQITEATKLPGVHRVPDAIITLRTLIEGRAEHIKFQLSRPDRHFGLSCSFDNGGIHTHLVAQNRDDDWLLIGGEKLFMTPSDAAECDFCLALEHETLAYGPGRELDFKINDSSTWEQLSEQQKA